MTQVTEVFASLGKSQAETLNKLAAIFSETTAKFVELNVKSAKASISDGARTAKAVSAPKDPSDLPAWVSSSLQPILDDGAAYARAAYGIAAAARAETATLLETHAAETRKQWAATLDTIAKTLPAGFEGFAPGWKSATATLDAVLDGWTRTGKDLVALADAGIANAPSVTPIRKKAA